jgi:hypothetical protein
MGSLTRFSCLANHHLKVPLLRCNAEDSGCSSGGGGDLLSQVRVHLSEPRKKNRTLNSVTRNDNFFFVLWMASTEYNFKSIVSRTIGANIVFFYDGKYIKIIKAYDSLC